MGESLSLRLPSHERSDLTSPFASFPPSRPSAASDTIPEPKFEGTKPVVVEADDDDDDEDDDEDENGVEAEEDESDEDISEDELAALQQDAGVEQEEEQPAAGRRARSSRTVVDYKKANDELGPDEDDE